MQESCTSGSVRVEPREGLLYSTTSALCGVFTSKDEVYTQKAHRRKHYAENLVYQVTKIVEDAGYTPMLYTNADYVASNACYEKIGYVLRGKLCTLG